MTTRQVKRWEAGDSDPYPRQLDAIAAAYRWPCHRIGELLARDGEEVRLAETPGNALDKIADMSAEGRPASEEPQEASDWTTVTPPPVDGLEAIELVRRVEASDAGPATIEHLQRATDLLCRSYTSTTPAEMLTHLRAYRRYLLHLLDGRATLHQRRELTVLAGWLSLLTAICNVDLHQTRAAALNLHAARTMAHEANHSLLTAWCLETEAWQTLTAGRPDLSVTLSQAARPLTSPGTSVYVQVTIQEARASALLGLVRETHRLLDESGASLDHLTTPEHAEHHFEFDRRKHLSYAATALAWLGDDDATAEDYARRAVEQYDVDPGDARWRSRLASARLDLALVLARLGQPSEAAQLGTNALDSGYLRPSNTWRAVDLDHHLARFKGWPEVTDYHDRLGAARPPEQRP